MNRPNVNLWFRFLKLILSKGSILIKPYDYNSHINQAWANNSEAKRLKIDYMPTRKSWKYYWLYLPIIGPLVAMVSQYRLQKRWPTYLYHWSEKKLGYIRIPKNASTSMQAAILQKQYSDIDISLLNSSQINEMGKNFVFPKPKPEYEYFTLIRNPYDRLLSCYFDQMMKRSNGHFYFNDYAFGILKEGMTFYEFVMCIKDIPDVIKDVHFKPQHYYINQVKKVKLFKMESNQEGLNRFMNEHNLSLGSRNKNKKAIVKEDYYSLEIKSVVADIYRKDFQLLGYSIEDLSITSEQAHEV